MRHFMVDPDNEERLLKVPRRVVDEIKAEALSGAVQRVEAYLEKYGEDLDPGVIAAIKGEHP